LLADGREERGSLLAIVLIGGVDRSGLDLLALRGPRDGTAAADRIDVVAVQGLVLEEGLGDAVEDVPATGEQLAGALVLLGHDAPDLAVDALGRLLGVCLALSEV